VGGYLSPVHQCYGKKSLQIPESGAKVGASKAELDQDSQMHRINMCHLGVSTSPWLDVSTWEVNQSTWTPTIQVLEAHREIISQHLGGDVQILFLCGADTVRSFVYRTIWSQHELELLFNNFGVVCIERPVIQIINRTSLTTTQFLLEDPFLRRFKESIYIVEPDVACTLSSTDIRRLLGDQLSARYWIPDSVLEYIRARRLYHIDEKSH